MLNTLLIDKGNMELKATTMLFTFSTLNMVINVMENSRVKKINLLIGETHFSSLFTPLFFPLPGRKKAPKTVDVGIFFNFSSPI